MTQTYLARIATKQCDVLLHPLKSDPLVAQAEVERTFLHSFRTLRESKRSKTVVERHKNDWRSLQSSSLLRVENIMKCDECHTRDTDCPTRGVPS